MRFSIVFLFILFQIPVFGQLDNWAAVINDGFGNSNNSAIIELIEFKDYLYACTSRTGSGAAEIWRSPNGDEGSWTPIIFDPTANQVKGIPSINTTTLGDGYMWIATGNPVGGGTVVYRTEDGVNWIPISKKGFGDPNNIVPAPHMVVFQGTNDDVPYLYAGASSHGEGPTAEVWRTPYTNTDSLNWELVIDFANIDVEVTQITYFYIWNNKIYFATNGKGQLWEAVDGVNFTKNTSVGNGFGDATSIAIACIVEFNDTLFVSTTNKMDGGHMYRTANGTDWTAITTDGFGKGPAAEELHNFDVFNGKIWITAYTNTDLSDGCPIWRSDNGWNFVQSNIDGFGYADINGENAVTTHFNGRQYFGGPNHITGGQIWRTDIMTNNIEQTLSDCYTNISPNPMTVNSSIHFGGNCPDISEIIIYNISGKRIKTLFVSNTNNIDIRTENLQSGMYFYTLLNKNRIIDTGKFIVARN